MRILVISDIHANLVALEAVLADAGHFDAAWCLGDLIGYGPNPNECIARVRRLPDLVCILGNHDAAVLDKVDVDSFNPEARAAIRWTENELSASSLAFIEKLPETTQVGSVTLAHGSPRHPVWEYLLDTRTATGNFEYFETPYCFVGHTHLPVLFHLPEAPPSGREPYARLMIPEPGSTLSILARSILNPGSVGQPRDRDPRAAYAIYDSMENTWDYRRIPYNIAETQARMAAAGLPERHIQRLASGW